jgi:Fe-S cluster biogenesis protein NfuA
MSVAVPGNEIQDRLKHLDDLLRKAERSADPAGKAQLQEIVQEILSLHGAGLGRMLGHMAEAGSSGQAILDACAEDEVVGGLLLLHGLHPLDLETRVHQALESVRPYLQSHGGNVQLLEVSEERVLLRLEGSCHHCPSSTATMRHTVEQAILARAPDVAAIEVEGLAPEIPVGPEPISRIALPLL